MGTGEADDARRERMKKRVADAAAVRARPPEQLPALPIAVRWEAVRRHPYYAAFWRDALRYRRDPLPAEEEERLNLYLAYLLVVQAGAVGEPIDPATPTEEFLKGDDPFWVGSSVRPVTLRDMAIRLLLTLPEHERLEVGWSLLRSAAPEYTVPGDDAGRRVQIFNQFEVLSQVGSAALDASPAEPVVYLHVAASDRALEADFKQVVRRWKTRRGVPPARGDSAKYPAYLKVWDLVENWKDGAYRPGPGLTFKKAARRSKRPLSTVYDQYRAAFRLVTGHDYTPALWWDLVAAARYAERLSGSTRAVLSAPLRRRVREPLPRDVPDSVVSPPLLDDEGDPLPGLVGSAPAFGDERWQLVRLDLMEMFRKGLRSDEILRRLGAEETKAADAEIAEVVEVFRERFALSGEV